MSVAYVDTSALLAIAFGERGATALARQLETFDQLVSSNLLEAELRAALVREGVSEAGDILDTLTWILPNRPLSTEIRQVLRAGYLKGADLWHVACALFIAESPEEMSFVSLDDRQRDVANVLGFAISK